MSDMIDRDAALLPCPFCGGYPRYREHWDEDLSTHNQVVWKSVMCINDCASVSIPDGYDGGTAIERWNTRATDPQIADLLTALEAERAKMARLVEVLRNSREIHVAIADHCLEQKPQTATAPIFADSQRARLAIDAALTEIKETDHE